MGFQRSAYTRYLVLGNAADHRFQPYPLAFPNEISPTNAPWPLAIFNTNAEFSVYDAGWNMGRRVNLFLETPNWEFCAYKITVRAFNANPADPTSTVRPILVAPNAVLNDPAEETANGAIPYYTFLMGNPVYPNGAIWNSNINQKVVSVQDASLNNVYPVRFESAGGVYTTEASPPLSFSYRAGCTAAGEIRLNYSAALKDVVGVGSRAGIAAANIVKPTDTIELIATGATHSNLAASNRLVAYSSNNYPIIVASRITAQGVWRLEFSAMIDNYGPAERPSLPAYTGLGTYSNPATGGVSVPTAYMANEIHFVYSGADVRGLARNNMTVSVVGRDLTGAVVFTGTLYNACNLTYCRNNKQQILDMFKDPGKYLNFSVADFAKTARPILPANSIATNQTNTYTFTYGNNQNGTQPIKTLAICDSSTAGTSLQTLVAVTVEPAE
jgi:hypothetical protein